MSSRTPAPDEFDRYSMPDLPGDLFEDDGPLYQPVDQTWYGSGFDREASWDDGYRRQRDEVQDLVDDRSRYRQRHMGSEIDGVVPGRRRSGHVHREVDGIPKRPGKQRGRREQRDEAYNASARASSIPLTRDGWDEPYSPRRRPRPTHEQSRRPVRTPSRQDRVVEQPRMRPEAVTVDVVTDISPSLRTPVSRPRRKRNPAWEWQSIVMPQPRQMLVQAAPSWLMAITVLGTLGLMGFIPGGLPLWAPMVLLPTLLLLLRADHDRHPMWGRAALVNLVVVGAFFPLMIVRQSFLRVPFVELGNGTLVMPILSTAMVVVGMAVIALGSAFLSQEDPEYAGMLFLPAAMLVPFFAGATEITNLSTALVVLGVIYAVVGFLTVIASMLPAAFPTLVAPVALALEFFVLPVSESTPIFPVGAGMSAKLLFFTVLAVGVGLTVAVPMMAVWVRKVRRIVQGRFGPRRSGQVAAGVA